MGSRASRRSSAPEQGGPDATPELARSKSHDARWRSSRQFDLCVLKMSLKLRSQRGRLLDRRSPPERCEDYSEVAMQSIALTLYWSGT